ncbi:MAG: hypothetical protein FRX48_09477 [Lasallia pustulata]|uniref:RNA polymerase II assembly factor Rtp1 C-terminal domain-containing protein n=1 Tax=Lasallia pustulata TaxID=136370 RepID=A0A5M8PCT9_9LECA|nr:MAG: hypothetical protein FRX48_09477 [Lasallia pustulata]
MAEKELAAAATFLAPVVGGASSGRDGVRSIIDSLSDAIAAPGDGDTTPRTAVIRRALALWLDLHRALLSSPDSSSFSKTLQSPSSRRLVDGLLDLISLEGIYPCLSPGVGIPIERRVKSVLRGGFVAKPVAKESGDQIILAEIVDSLHPIVKEGSKGLGLALRERTLVDVIAGAGQLAFDPSEAAQQRHRRYGIVFKVLLEQIPLPTLLPTLTSLIRPTGPAWFQTPIKTALAVFPMRPGGVRQTISFVATSEETYQSIESQPEEQSNERGGSAFSLEKLGQVSKLLTSVPSSVTPNGYYSAIAPQLLELLDEDGTEMCRAAAYVISIGILGRRQHGAPGSIGWKLFAEPIIETFSPSKASSSRLDGFDLSNEDTEIIVEEVDLRRALSRLCALVLIHPNPQLTKRIVSPMPLLLWGLLCCARKANRANWYSKATSVLNAYYRSSASVAHLSALSEHLMWDGTSWWNYVPGPNNGVEIRRYYPHEPDMVDVMQEMDDRVNYFFEVLQTDIVDDDGFAAVFLHVSKHWLLEKTDTMENKQQMMMLGYENEADPLNMLVYAKLVQRMLEESRDKLMARPDRIIELVKQLIDTFVEQRREARRRQTSASRPSRAGLGQILGQTGPASSISNEDSIDIVSTALSLLSTIISSPDFAPNQSTITFLTSLQPSLNYLTNPQSSIPPSLTMAVTNISVLLAVHISPPSILNLSAHQAPTSRAAEDRKTHSLALNYLISSAPPVRAEGLSLATALIRARSPMLEIPATTVLLLSVLQDDEEFIYLNAVKSLGLLAANHPKTVVRMLVDAYVDVAEEAALDQRLRIGEALLKTIERLGGMLVGDTARLVGEGMIGVAGRRGRKSKGQEKRKKEAGKKKEAEDAWGGEIPTVGGDEGHDEANARLAKVLEGWEGREGEDDVRIRTSAVSILGVAIETNIAGIGSTMVSTAVDLAISILKAETTQDKAILRRAAVLLFMSLIRALDKAGEEGRQLGFGFAGENLAEVVAVLQYVGTTDSDDLVVGHVKAVIGSLEAWKSKSLLGVTTSQLSELTPQLGLVGKGLAGLSVNPDIPAGSRPVIEEMD